MGGGDWWWWWWWWWWWGGGVHCQGGSLPARGTWAGGPGAAPSSESFPRNRVRVSRVRRGGRRPSRSQRARAGRCTVGGVRVEGAGSEPANIVVQALHLWSRMMGSQHTKP